LDQGKKLSREERRNYWQDGFERTWLLYLKQGWLKVTS